MQDKVVLLVEDNEDDEMLTLMALKSENMKNRIDVVRDGAEAIDYLFGTGVYAGHQLELPELILLDLKLPKMDGLEVLKRIRTNEKTKLLPVVILTSSTEHIDLMRGYENGANSYIVKPVDIAKFREAIQQLGLYWLVLNESSSKVDKMTRSSTV